MTTEISYEAATDADFPAPVRSAENPHTTKVAAMVGTPEVVKFTVPAPDKLQTVPVLDSDGKPVTKKEVTTGADGKPLTVEKPVTEEKMLPDLALVNKHLAWLRKAAADAKTGMSLASSEPKDGKVLIVFKTKPKSVRKSPTATVPEPRNGEAADKAPNPLPADADLKELAAKVTTPAANKEAAKGSKPTQR